MTNQQNITQEDQEIMLDICNQAMQVSLTQPDLLNILNSVFDFIRPVARYDN